MDHGRSSRRRVLARLARPGFWITVLLTLASLPACRTTAPTMSLEEAKHVTASSSGLATPPRTIRDVLSSLAWTLQSEPVSIWSLRAAADAPDPEAAASAEEKGRSYSRRGRAARRIGRFAQAVADMTRAGQYVLPRTGIDERTSIWFRDLGLAIQRDLAETLAASGNHREALTQYQRTIQDVPRNDRGWLFELLPGLVQLYGATGDRGGAERAFRELLDLHRESADWPSRRRPGTGANWDADVDASVLRAEAAVREMRGQFAEAEGLWRESIALLRAAIEAAASGSVPWLQERHDAATVGLARCLLRQGRLLEAEAEARRALQGKSRQGGFFPSHNVGVVSLLGQILREQGRYPEAEALARAAARIYEQGGASPVSSPAVVAPKRELAALLAAQGRWSDALAQYETVRSQLQDDRLYARLVESDPAYLLALVKGGRPAEVVRLVEPVLAESVRTLGERHVATAVLRGLAAMARAALGDTSRALVEFETAAKVMLDRSTDLGDEGTTRSERDQRVRVVLGSYVDLLTRTQVAAAARASIDGVAEAFRLADVVRGRAVQRALDATAARNAPRTPALADLVRREQDATREIAALHGLLAAAYGGPENPQATADLRARIDKLQRARQALGAKIAREFPAYAHLVNPPPVTVEETRVALRPGEALIATLVTEQTTYVWAVSPAKPVAFATVPVGEKALATTVRRLRRALDPQARRLGEIPAFDVAAAHELYRLLLEPVRAGWASAESLLVVGHGPLGPLPFGVLVTERTVLGVEHEPPFANYRSVPWLARRYAVTTLPSASALVTLRRLPAGPTDRRPFVGFGDPYFNAEQARKAEAEAAAATVAEDAAPQVSTVAMAARAVPLVLRQVIVSPAAEAETSRLAMLPRLPDTAEEIRGIARVTGADLERDVFLGAPANERTVKKLDLSRYRVIAFATHGLVPGDLDGLTQPALALTAPEVAKVEGDGLLTMEEILALRLDADWVVLSACNTTNGVGTGAEAISGLGRAFFYAGARALLVTHWPVETTSARALTTALFRRQAAEPGLSRAKALQQTMGALIDDGGLIDPQTGTMVFSYAHPIFWAPFALVGDGG